MQFTDQDFKEVEQLAPIVVFCDQSDIKTLEKVVDDIYKHQPFLISIFLGYKDDVSLLQHDELLKVILIIWLFFKERKQVKKIPIKEAQFEQRQKKNIQFLQHLDQEPTLKAKELTTDLNLGELKSKALFSVVLFRIRDGKHLRQLDQEVIGIIILGMKSLIECFEDIS